MNVDSKSSEDRAVLASVAARLNRQGHWPAVWLMTDLARLPDPVAAINGLPRGAGVIVRDYDLPNRRDYARGLVRAARARNLAVLIAGSAPLAQACGADGVHLPAYASGRARAIGQVWPGAAITAAAHNEAQIIAAARAGVDGVFISPVFATGSHQGAAAMGPMRFAGLTGLAHKYGLAAFALGGINKQTAPKLISSGADGLAAIGALSV